MEDQKKNIAEMERLDKLRVGGKCADEEIVVEIDGVQLRVPRYGTDIKLKDGTTLSGIKEVPYLCDLKVVFAISMNQVHWGIFEVDNPSNQSEYNNYVQGLLRSNLDKTITSLEGSIKKIEFGNYQLYIMKKNGIMTIQ